ncbi:MAG: hypothetical protein MZV64_48560 [Ignavibacteriales bacterium]|nr:hypothetical protein [Ignavibacteriales bacterium]
MAGTDDLVAGKDRTAPLESRAAPGRRGPCRGPAPARTDPRSPGSVRDRWPGGRRTGSCGARFGAVCATRAGAGEAETPPGPGGTPIRRPASVGLDLGAVEESDDDDVPGQRERTLHVAGAGAVEDDRFTLRIHVQHVAHGEAGSVVVIQRDERAATTQFIEQRRDPVPAMKRKAVSAGDSASGNGVIRLMSSATRTWRRDQLLELSQPWLGSTAVPHRRPACGAGVPCADGCPAGAAAAPTEAAFSDATSALQRSSWRSTSVPVRVPCGVQHRLAGLGDLFIVVQQLRSVMAAPLLSRGDPSSR